MKRYRVVVYVSFGPIGTPGYEYWVNAMTPEGAKAAALDEAGKEYPGHALIAGRPQRHIPTRADREAVRRQRANFAAQADGREIPYPSEY